MAKNEKKKDNKIKKNFLKDFKAELKKVIWPTPKQLVNNTIAVVTIVIITAIIVFALDVVFDLGNKYGISRLQSIVNDKYNNSENDDNNSNTDSTQNTSSTSENDTDVDTDGTSSIEKNKDGESDSEE